GLPGVQRLLRAPHLHAAGSDQPGFARQRHGIRAGGAGALQGGSREPTRPAHRTGCPRLRQGTGDPGATLVEHGTRSARARRWDPRTRRIESAPNANRHDRNAEIMKLTTAVAALSLFVALGCSKKAGGGASRVPVTVDCSEPRTVPYDLYGSGPVDTRNTDKVSTQ